MKTNEVKAPVGITDGAAVDSTAYNEAPVQPDHSAVTGASGEASAAEKVVSDPVTDGPVDTIEAAGRGDPAGDSVADAKDLPPDEAEQNTPENRRMSLEDKFRIAELAILGILACILFITFIMSYGKKKAVDVHLVLDEQSLAGAFTDGHAFSEKAVLGVTCVNLAEGFGTDMKPVGIEVTEVQEKGSAFVSGIKPGDIITAIDGFRITDTALLQDVISKYHPGDFALVEIRCLMGENYFVQSMPVIFGR